MKPAHERNQECLPPKKRDLPVSNSSGSGGGVGAAGGGAGSSAGGGIGEDEVVSIQNSASNSDTQRGTLSGEWLRAQPGLHYGVDNSDGIPAVPVDQYSMLYKVALPSVTYSSASLHPVLSHISPTYTVHSPLLQHPGLSYPPLGYAQIPHSSLQFVGSPYAAVPYALPPGFVPGSLISPSGTIPQPHAVSHLVPYPSVIQEGVVSPPPQAQVAAHTFAKVAASSGVPLMLPSEQVAQQHLGTVGVLSATEVSSRGMPVFYHPQGARVATRDTHSAQQENEPEMNGGDKEQGAREVVLDLAYTARNARLLQVASSSAAQEHSQDRGLQNRRLEERSSPGQRSTPDSDLEVQQVVGRFASSSQGGIGVRKEVSFAPLNLSQGAQRARDVHGESTGVISGRTAYTAQPVSYSDPRVTSLQQQTGQPGHAVMLANGQPVLIPLEYHLQHQSQPPQQHYPGQANDASASHASTTMASPNLSFKASDSSARVCLPERAEPTIAQQQLPQQSPVQSTADVTQALASSLAPATAPCNPSHFMKGAIIQLATGELKRVEDLQTQDFVRSAEVSGGLKIDSSMVVDIRASQQRPGLVSLHFTVGEQQSKVTIDVPPEHPFFVFGQGWSSCSPERTAQLYGLACHHLQVGDVCVSITLQQQLQPQQQKQPQHHHSQQQQQQQQNLSRTLSKSNATSGPGHQLMGPPAPQQSRPQSHFRLDRIHRERQRDGEKDVVDKEEATHFGVVGHTESPIRPSRTSAEHPRSQSSYHLHTEGSAFAGAGMGAMQAALGASQRRWSSPGLQRYNMKGDEGPRPQISTSGHTRPSFIPQEVKVSIEGRSNAGK
ncbi:ataxin-1-like [Siniperca chuatsi]|uniref:ataxin-1-like n=1 Tax=Siniperca chuatsi TaxID=119488 RepID=UPI001CE22D51|nr:ataxin-1-like [Siniperca chuatsi]XP_044052813.1 ataxin-1-like [Siniperca chuatsi]